MLHGLHHPQTGTVTETDAYNHPLQLPAQHMQHVWGLKGGGARACDSLLQQDPGLVPTVHRAW